MEGSRQLDSYMQHRSIQESIAPNLGAADTTYDVLSSLKLMEWGIKEADKPALKEIAAHELKYIAAATKALSPTGNPLLREKLGRGFSSAMVLAKLLRQRDSEKIFNETLDKSLGEISKDSYSELVQSAGSGVVLK